MRSLFTIEADKDKKFSYNLKASFSKPYRPKKKRKKKTITEKIPRVAKSAATKKVNAPE